MSGINAITSDFLKFEWEIRKYFASHYIKGN